MDKFEIEDLTSLAVDFVSIYPLPGILRNHRKHAIYLQAFEIGLK